MKFFAAAAIGALLAFAPLAQAEDTLAPHWQSEGVFGSYNKTALQRGFLVYETVCASCHAASQLHYRDLDALGFTTAQIAAIASNVKLANGATAGLDDTFKNPFPDPVAAASAFGGAIPVDLSTLVTARPGGTRYVYDILTSYADAPDSVNLMAAHYYDSAYPGDQIAMPPPLKDNAVEYADGVKPTVAQEAADVAAFLTWAAEPNLDARKEIGVRAILFLLFLFFLAVATKRRIWRESI